MTRIVLQEVCFRPNAGPAATDDNWGPREVKLILDMTREKVEAATVVRGAAEEKKADGQSEWVGMQGVAERGFLCAFSQWLKICVNRAKWEKTKLQ